MQKIVTRNKDFRTVSQLCNGSAVNTAMQKPKLLSELLEGHGKQLRALNAALRDRQAVLEAVRRALPPKLGAAVVSAGIDHGRLSIGVASAAWATRLRYVTAELRSEVGKAMEVDITGIRIRIVPPSAKT
jgi:hypothetical protein